MHRVWAEHAQGLGETCTGHVGGAYTGHGRSMHSACRGSMHRV